MALCYDLPVYRETYKLLLGIFVVTREFTREYKYSLWQDYPVRKNDCIGDMRRDALELTPKESNMNNPGRSPGLTKKSNPNPEGVEYENI